MYYVFAVHVVEGFEALVYNVLYYILSESLIESCLKDICEAACVKIFDEYPESVLEIVSIVILDNVLMVAD